MTELKLKEGLLNADFVTQLLISVYLTLTLLTGISVLYSTELGTESPFMIGEATANGVDISSRISNFYKILLIGQGSIGLFYFGISRLLKSFISGLHRKNEITVVVALQAILLALNYLSSQKTQSEVLFHLTIISLFLIEAIEYFSKRSYTFLKNDNLKALFLVATSLFVVTENIFITATIMLALVLLLRNNLVQGWLNTIVIIFAAFPLLLFLTVEITLIANQNGFYNSTYWLTGSVLLACLLIMLFILKVNKRQVSTIIYNWQGPLIVAGIALFVAYNPLHKDDNSLFEIANNLNPLMMSGVHNSTYFVDYISSHLLSDYIWMKLYALLNGYQNEMAPLIYYGFSWALYVVVIYSFLKEYVSRHFGVLIFMLFTPYLFFYFPHSYAFALIPVLFLIRYFKTEKNRYLWWFAIASTLTVFWRLDLGVATVGAALIIFCLMFLFERQSRYTLLKIGSVLALFYGSLFIIYYSFCSNLIHEALHYFGGSQGHGVSELVKESSNLFYLDYFILPVLIGICSIILLFRYQLLKRELFYWPILFFIGFYFFNFQRGLVRHSFIEMNETYVSSFGWIIIGFLLVGVFRKKVTIGIFAVLTLAGFLLSIHQVDKSFSLVDRKKMFSVNHLPLITGKKIDRSPEGYDYVKYTKPVVTFLRDNLNSNETFFDFSNSPMLYYKTEKKIPAYFSQSLQYIVDLYLQHSCIENLKNTNIPFVVYSQTVDAFGDKIDGIPNNVRYHYIASYLIDQYTPSNDYGLFHIWKKKDSIVNDSTGFKMRPEVWELGLIPYYWKANKDEPQFNKKRKVKLNNGKAELGRIVGGDFIQLTVKSKKETELKIRMEKDSSVCFFVKIDIKEGVFDYKFPLCGSYYVRTQMNPIIEFELDNGTELTNIEILNQSY